MAELRLQDRDRVRWVARRNVAARDRHGNKTRIAMVFCELENGHRFTHAIPEAQIAFVVGDKPELARQLAENAFIENEVKIAAAREKTR